jgi:small-conductance mechanosensitive channel
MLSNVLNMVLLGNTLWAWASALLIIIATMLALHILRAIVINRVRSRVEQSTTDIDDLILGLADNTKYYLLFFVALGVGATTLDLSQTASEILYIALITALLIQAGIWGNYGITHILTYRLGDRMQDPNTASAATAIGFVGRLVLWSLVGLLILDNLPNVEITSLIAGLGITGVAVALAVQNILQDLFASMSIILDKPFVIGDFIIVGELMGSVENIGLKTTRVRSLYGEELIFSNSDLLNSRIRNYKGMARRLVTFTLGVTYETPAEKLAAIPGMIEEIIEAQSKATFNRAHFKAFGDFSLDFEIVYFVEDPDYTLYMDIQQTINLALFKQFAEQGIEFAYPTQVLYVNNNQSMIPGQQ